VFCVCVHACTHVCKYAYIVCILTCQERSCSNCWKLYFPLTYCNWWKLNYNIQLCNHFITINSAWRGIFFVKLYFFGSKFVWVKASITFMAFIFWDITPCQFTFWKNTSPLFVFVCCLLHAGFFVGLLLNPKNGGHMLLWNKLILSRSMSDYRRGLDW
jgi:hypothetical protein